MSLWSLPGLLELIRRGFQLGSQPIIEGLLDANAPEQVVLARRQEPGHSRLALPDPVHGHIVDVPVLERPDDCHLHFDRHGAVLRLLEQLNDALAAVVLTLCRGLALRAALGAG